MDKLIIAVCVLGIVVVLSHWALNRWDHLGRESTEKRSHRRLLEEVRRHSEKEEGR